MTPDAKGEFRIRMALAGHAHDAGIVRLASDDLTGFDYLVATRKGLFVARPGAHRQIAYGQFYGIAIDGDTIYAFEACDRPRIRSHRGRIVRLRHRAGRIAHADVLVRTLDNGCHQIDIIDGALYVTDTYNQRLLRIPLDGDEPEPLHPIPAPVEGDPDSYHHVNSLLACGDAIYLLLHNDSGRTGRDSAIAVFDRLWNRTGTIPLAGQGCHSLAMLEDGTLLSCGSAAGEIIGTDGRAIKISGRMTRGLSVDAAQIVVGGSVFLEREARDDAPGSVDFLTRDYAPIGSVELPGPVMEIRRIDGQDRSLSAFLANEKGRAPRPAPCDPSPS
jgi:hypothetical protein